LIDKGREGATNSWGKKGRGRHTAFRKKKKKVIKPSGKKLQRGSTGKKGKSREGGKKKKSPVGKKKEKVKRGGWTK